MSQSPVEDFSENSVIRYRQGWQALNRLLHEDRSFSGHEKHNVFLNGGGGRFADISAVAGLDFPEDGRAIGSVDWDFDGDLDLWITNRTAPRTRLMINQGDPEGAFLAVFLEGDGQSTNRDAIGARVTIHPEPGGKPLIRTKYAGESFLSQSSSWLHFGLGSREGAVDVTVRWPGGGEERFSQLTPNTFYRLVQGTGEAVSWSEPGGLLDLAADPLPVPQSEPDLSARIVLPGGLAFPPITNPDGEAIALGASPTLVNVWASWCRPCLEELSAWTAAEDRLKEAGVKVLALNVDEEPEGRAKAIEILEKLKAPFDNSALSPESARSLDLIQRATLDRWEAMPVPCSFLVDDQGFIAAIYKGPATIGQILADASRLLRADPQTRRMAAVPFPGIWTHDPPLPDPLFAAVQFVDYNLVPAALRYLQHATELDQRLRSDRFTNIDFADRYLVMATLLNEQDLPAEAIRAYQRARDLNPRDLRIRRNLGDLLRQQNRTAEAIDEWEEARKINPEDLTVPHRLAMTYLQMRQPAKALVHLQALVRAQPRNPQYRYLIGTAFQYLGYYPQAIAAFKDAAKLNPNLLNAENNIAWIRATHPDDALRDGAEAVRLAEAICARTGHRNPNWLDTLSAAYAETGQFDKALEAVDRMMELLQNSDSPKAAQLLKKFAARKTLFEGGKAYRDDRLESAK